MNNNQKTSKMQNTIKQMMNDLTFNSLLINAGIEPAPREESNAERFDNWMRNTVKSVYYADNLEMTKGYERIS